MVRNFKKQLKYACIIEEMLTLFFGKMSFINQELGRILTLYLNS